MDIKLQEQANYLTREYAETMASQFGRQIVSDNNHYPMLKSQVKKSVSDDPL